MWQVGGWLPIAARAVSGTMRTRGAIGETMNAETTTMMRRHAIYFNEQDQVSGVVVYASPDVIAQLRTCLDQVKDEPSGQVILPIADAAKAAKWAGGLSPLTSPDYPAMNAIYECLTYGVFNTLWENGVDGALAGEDSY